MSLTTLIKPIQDIMRKDVGVDGDAQRISQMVWLIFLKIFDDKEQEWQLTISNYKSPLPSRFRWSSWAKNPEGMTGEELIDFVNNDLFPALKKLATAAGVSPHGKVVGSVFEDAYNYMKSGTLLRQVINTIEEDVDFNKSGDRHLFNDIYEKILSDLQSAGNAGEYYTHRAVTQFMVDMLDPQLGQTILDPACGTGGFLTCAIEHLRKTKQIKNNDDRKVLQNCIQGVEKKPLPHMLAMTNMMLHGIDVPTNVRHDNTLSRPLKEYGPRDRVDLIITNPPFGGMEEDGIENNFPRKYQTRETADLFMALIMHLLKHDTGKAAVVLPDGFLFGEGTKTNLKRELLEEFSLHTIVRLPKGVFSPYTSIATNILFFEKGGPTKEVWFFAHPYPEGYKSYSRSKPLTIAEFDLEKSWWGGAERKRRKTTEQAWKVLAKDLAERNYNLDCKNPHEVEVNHRDPEELMVEYQQIVHQLEAAQQALKAELMACLGGEGMKKVSHEDTKGLGMSKKKKTGKEVSIVRSSAAEYLTFVAASGSGGVEAVYADESIWLTQKMMGVLYDVETHTINYHLKKVFSDSELQEDSVIRNFRITAADGKSYSTKHYKLPAIIAVGYKVNSERAVQFRKWATGIIDEYTIKAYVMDDERIKSGGSILTEQYFEEQLQRIREIRLSERKFYQKITDIYATAIDYDITAQATKRFFATVQNKLHWAIHGQTAAEVIVNRANAEKQHMGLTTWKDAPQGKIQKFDASVAKNYLTEEEMAQLARLLNAYLDVAEDMALRKMPMTMQDWETRLNRFIAATDREILQDAGKVTAEIAKAHAESEFEKYRIVQDRLFESDFDRMLKQIEAIQKPGGGDE